MFHVTCSSSFFSHDCVHACYILCDAFIGYILHFRREDIALHEFAHALHDVAKYAISDFQSRLVSLYQNAKDTGLWNDTYAMTNHAEYFVSLFIFLYFCIRFKYTKRHFEIIYTVL